MMTPRRSTDRSTDRSTRSVIGYSLGLLGVLIVVATLAFHAWLHLARPDEGHDFLYFPTIVGAVLGWWGFFWADSHRARQGGEFLVSARERWMRAGRRETDPVAVVADPALDPAPVERPTERTLEEPPPEPEHPSPEEAGR